MNWKVGEAKGVLQMSNQSAISKTRRLLKGQKNRMSNARTLGKELEAWCFMTLRKVWCLDSNLGVCVNHVDEYLTIIALPSQRSVCGA